MKDNNIRKQPWKVAHRGMIFFSGNDQDHFNDDTRREEWERDNRSYFDKNQSRGIRRGRSNTVWVGLALAFLVLVASTRGASADLPPDYLTSESVVLITGAAGFIGSELAMALHRVYHPKTIICIDSMEYIPTSKSKTNSNDESDADSSSQSGQNLSLMEFKRQRAFHVMQTLGPVGVFYRTDFRPSIPEYFDIGEVPVLDYIFRDYPDITHVVHLADAYNRADPATQAIPRVKEDIRSGMMEALLEQIVRAKQLRARDGSEGQGRPLPHLTYASSYEVYNYFRPTKNDPNPSPFREEKPITTPSSLRGATKLIDEILVRSYFDTQQIYSIGVRFFPVYGPWSLVGTPLFEMAERAVTSPLLPVVTAAEKDSVDDVRDYVYIDDAVDALLSAMQFRTLNGVPTVVNVGTGKGSSLRDIARLMEEILPRTQGSDEGGSNSTRSLGEVNQNANVAVASTDRAKQILRFEAQVPLKEGLTRMLSWHYDRAFPTGGPFHDETKEVASQGIVSCSPYDKECLKGAPVFPCASECAHETQCTSSYYDDVLALTKALTRGCETVMYTIALEDDLEAIPSANIAISPQHESFMERSCNIAYVSERSTLVRRLKQEGGFPIVSTVVEELLRMAGRRPRRLHHGMWTLVPVFVPSFSTGDEHILKLLPKLSPGRFFADQTRHAIYCDPDVLFRDVRSLMEEAQMQPFQDGVEGATAMLIGHNHPSRSNSQGLNMHESVQNAAYRMIQIGVIEEISSRAIVDSSWMIHTLQNADSRFFRCDVFTEVVQWDVGTDSSALEFIMGLHDMWSRVIVRNNGKEPWWIGDDVVTIREKTGSAREAMEGRRKLTDVKNLDEPEIGVDVDEERQDDDNVVGQEQFKAGDDQPIVDEGIVAAADTDTEDEEVNVAVAAESDDTDESPFARDGVENDSNKEDKRPIFDTENAGLEAKEGKDQAPAEDAQKGNNEEVNDSGEEERSKGEDGVDVTDKKFTVDEENQEANPEVEKIDGEVAGDGDADVEVEAGAFVGSDKEDVPRAPQKDKDSGDQADEEVDIEPETLDEVEPPKEAEADLKDPKPFQPARDLSSYDTWMGILPPTDSVSVHYFVRIVPSSEVGVIFLEDLGLSSSTI